MGRSCPNLVWAITFDWSALTNWSNHSWTPFWSPFQVAIVVSLKRASKMQRTTLEYSNFVDDARTKKWTSPITSSWRTKVGQQEQVSSGAMISTTSAMFSTTIFLWIFIFLTSCASTHLRSDQQATQVVRAVCYDKTLWMGVAVFSFWDNCKSLPFFYFLTFEKADCSIFTLSVGRLVGLLIVPSTSPLIF